MDDRFAVLVVEDDEDLRDTLREIIEAEGVAVATAADGRAAIDALAAGLRPSLVLLDLMMPSMNGWEALSAIRGDHALADVPVAVLSAAGAHARPPGATHFLRKPIDIDALLDLVRGLRSADPDDREEVVAHAAHHAALTARAARAHTVGVLSPPRPARRA